MKYLIAAGYGLAADFRGIASTAISARGRRNPGPRARPRHQPTQRRVLVEGVRSPLSSRDGREAWSGSLGIAGTERYLGAVSWLAPLSGFLGAVLGAALAGFVAWRTSNSRMAADIQARWDAALLERGTDFVTAARSLRHHSERFARSADKDGRRVRLDEAQEQLRTLSEQLRLVGSRRVQVAARSVVHHAYAVRIEGEEGRDPRGEEYPDQKPIGRLNDALQEFHRAVRVQLHASDPEDVVHDDDLEILAGGLQPLPMSKRSSHA